MLRHVETRSAYFGVLFLVSSAADSKGLSRMEENRIDRLGLFSRFVIPL
jgi:hypothetical protein